MIQCAHKLLKVLKTFLFSRLYSCGLKQIFRRYYRLNMSGIFVQVFFYRIDISSFVGHK